MQQHRRASAAPSNLQHMLIYFSDEQVDYFPLIETTLFYPAKRRDMFASVNFASV